MADGDAASPGLAFHENVHGRIPGEGCLFMQACDETRSNKSGRTAKARRWVGVNGGGLFIAEEPAGARAGGPLGVSRLVQARDLQKVVIQKKNVRRFGGLSRPVVTSTEHVVLVKSKAGPPDTLLQLVADKADVPETSGPVKLAAALAGVHRQATGGDELLVEMRPAEDKRKASDEAVLTRPPGFEPPVDDREPPAEVPGAGPGGGPSSPALAPANTPPQIWFASLVKPELSGAYAYSGQEDGKPQWTRDNGAVIYQHTSGRWAVTDKVSKEAGDVQIVSSEVAQGRMPHEMLKGWCVMENSTWEVQATTQAAAHPELGVPLLRQTELAALFSSALKLSDYYKAQCVPHTAEQRERVKAVDADLSEARERLNAVLGENTALLRPISSGSSLTPEELERVKELSGLLVHMRADMRHKVSCVEEALGMASSDTREPGVAAAEPDPLRATEAVRRYAPLTAGAAPTTDADRHPDDRLMWGYTMQSSSLTQNGDTLLKFTCKADIFTSAKESLCPSALAITDTTLYICSIVDGKVLCPAAANALVRLTSYKDRRMLGIALSNNMQLYIHAWETEHLLVQYLTKLCPHMQQTYGVLDDEVEDPEMRKLLGLHPPAVERLEKELQYQTDEATKWKEYLAKEKETYKKDCEDLRLSEEDRASGNLKAAAAEKEQHRCELAVVRSDHEEAAVRWAIEREEAQCWLHIVGDTVRSLGTEGERWGRRAQDDVRAEQARMVLASTAIVERTERLDIALAESDERASAAMSIVHPVAYAALSEAMQGAEKTERYSIFFLYAHELAHLVGRHNSGIVDAASAGHAALVRMRHDMVSTETDLAALRETYDTLSAEHTAEVNKTGALLRSNKVLSGSLTSCRFADIARVQVDSVQLVEDTNRRRLEMECLVMKQLAALEHAQRCLEEGGASSGKLASALAMHVHAAGVEADGIAQGQISEAGVRHLQSACARMGPCFGKLQEANKRALDNAATVLRAVAAGFVSKQSEHLWADGAQYVAYLQPAVYPEREGWLFFNQNPVLCPQEWNKRYFVFSGGVLRYKHPNSGRFVRLFSIETVVSVTPQVHKESLSSHQSPQRLRQTPTEGNYFSVETAGNDPFTKFSCLSKADQVDWVALLRNAVRTHLEHTGRRVSAAAPSPPAKAAGRRRRPQPDSEQGPESPQSSDDAAVASPPPPAVAPLRTVPAAVREQITPSHPPRESAFQAAPSYPGFVPPLSGPACVPRGSGAGDNGAFDDERSDTVWEDDDASDNTVGEDENVSEPVVGTFAAPQRGAAAAAACVIDHSMI
eukprot:Rhum_TRINITY_DN275_c0_g1::Rhum_TRINITY_DN275_c0_g1_i1::g.996::m.996